MHHLSVRSPGGEGECPVDLFLCLFPGFWRPRQAYVQEQINRGQDLCKLSSLEGPSWHFAVLVNSLLQT